MKTTSKLMSASLITAIAAAILFISCQDPQPANDTPPVDTMNVQPEDTSAAAHVDTAAAKPDTTTKDVSEK